MKSSPRPDLDPTKGYLTSLTLENIRCFGSPAETMSLTKPGSDTQPARWTVILGANGVGKTTALRAISGFSGEPEYHPVPSTPLITYDPVQQVFARFKRISRQPLLTGNIQIANSAQDSFGGHFSFVSLQSGGTNATGYSSRYGPRLAAYGAGRAWRGSNEISSGATDTLSDRDARVRNPSETLFHYDYREKSEKLNRPSRFEAFKKALTCGILPLVTDLRMGFAADDRPIIEFATPDGWIALDDMSWGYQVFAAFAADYASRLIEWYPDSKAPLHEPGICLVDELDLHMHPKWQREVIDHLSNVFPATQFIVTVHSPLVVQAAEDANLVVLKRYPDDQSRVHIDNDVEAIKGWRIDQVLTSDLFGLDSARSIPVADDLAERRKLLGKNTLTRKESARLKVLEEGAMSLPIPGSAFEQEALKLVAEAAAKLKHLG